MLIADPARDENQRRSRAGRDPSNHCPIPRLDFGGHLAIVRGDVCCEASEHDDPKGTPGQGRIYADDWEQASHNGDLAHAVEAGVLDRDDVVQLGDVLAGMAEGRKSDRDITVFDSTGLAIQDLTIALAAMECADELDLATVDIG
jgi:ornithine cyclodeaminase/alanine dehydrogenase-like protein (mu-crystallin family)